MLEQPTRDRRAERHEATRAEILDAAWAIAREEGLGAITLREIARRVGMQAPSLYSYFTSKNDLYDAMFGQAWEQLLAYMPTQDELPSDPRAALRMAAGRFFDFSVADAARFLLMTQRVIPGFEPSSAAYAPAVESMDTAHRLFDRLGLPPTAVDLYTALISGLCAQQIANDPGGDRWKKQLEPAIDAFCDYFGLAKSKPTTRPRGKR